MQRTSYNSGLRRRQNGGLLEGSCPRGGEWYACSDASGLAFVGCCTIDPCTSNGCPAGNLKAAGLGDLPHGEIPDQACLAGGRFWTCEYADFWGCCKSNPCSSGCSDEDLSPASLIQVQDNPFSNPSTGNTPAGPQVSQVQAQSGRDGPSVGLIAGVAVGGFILALGLVALIWYLRRRSRRQKKAQAGESTLPTANSQGNPPPMSQNFPVQADSNYTGSSMPGKQFPPSTYPAPHSPQLPQYQEVSHEAGSTEIQGKGISQLSSPGLGVENTHLQSQRPMSYELVGSPVIGALGVPGDGPVGSSSPMIIPATVSELPADHVQK